MNFFNEPRKEQFDTMNQNLFLIASKISGENTERYGIRVDKSNSNPNTRVSYIGSAVGFTPMSGNDGNFQWGSWEDIFNSLGINPVVLKNKKVSYYLNPYDFTKKANGSASNLTGVDGDVMIEFSKPIWYKWTDEGATYTIEISDMPFYGAVKHAFEVEDGYNQMPYYTLFLTQILLVIFFKSTDSQTALGRGYVDANTEYALTGNTNSKGMFYGESTGKLQNKFLGIEDYYGNKLYWIDGVATDASHNILIGNSDFNNSGSGYKVYSSGIVENTAGYIDKVQGGNDKGFILSSASGSATTNYCDYGDLYSSRVARFGGNHSYGSGAGLALLRLYYSASYADATIGSRLFCKANNKIYIGAYLGTTQSGKLRSVSGTTPSDNKTISVFRDEAKANNI